jgi:hypothetical protein
MFESTNEHVKFNHFVHKRSCTSTLGSFKTIQILLFELALAYLLILNLVPNGNFNPHLPFTKPIIPSNQSLGILLEWNRIEEAETRRMNNKTKSDPNQPPEDNILFWYNWRDSYLKTLQICEK